MSKQIVNFCVVFTEFQLLQAEAIISDFRLEGEVFLILGENSRINSEIINQELFAEVIRIPRFANNGSIKKLSPIYIKQCRRAVDKLLAGRQVRCLIGAADENTFFALLKRKCKANLYWNIEDGIGNYRKFGIKNFFITQIKRMIFLLYGGFIPIAAQKGVVKSDKKFRMNPSLSTSSNNIELTAIVKKYIDQKKNFLEGAFYKKKFRQKSYLVISHEKTVVTDKHILDKAIIKPHPKFTIDDFQEDHYFTGKISAEILPSIYPSIEVVVYDSYLCSSLLNILMLYSSMKICITFDVEQKYKSKPSLLQFYKELKQMYQNRFISYEDLLLNE